MTVQTQSETAVRRRFTAEEFHQMAEAGIFTEDDRLELIDGEVIVMPPIGRAHMQCVLKLDRLFNERILRADRADVFVSIQNPLRLGLEQEPEPDMALLHLPHGMEQIPGPEAALRGGRRARDVDVALDEDAVEVCRQPTGKGYAKRQRVERGKQLHCTVLPQLDALPGETILGPPSN